MSKLVWDKVGERLYETGCDHGVLYPIQTGGQYNKGVAWNGLSAVTESPSGAEPSPIYADNIKYLNLMSAEDFGGTIEAYTSPDEFAECDGSVEVAPGVFAGQQSRKQFGLSYRTILGNDVESNDYGYKHHLVYGCLASVSEKGYTTVSDSPEAIALSWEFSTTPVEITKTIDGKKMKPTAILTLDSTRVDAKKMAALEEILYGKDPTTPDGTDGVEPRLPLPDEVIELLGAEDRPLTSFSVSPEDGEATLLGKTVAELQSNIQVGDNTITGTLKYVTGYTEFNAAKVEEQSGNYIAMRVEPDDANAVIKVELVGGTSGKGLITLDPDRQFVFRITNKATQKIKVVVVNGDDSSTKIYSLSGLKLETK